MMTLKGGWRISFCAFVAFASTQLAQAAAIVGSMQEPFSNSDYPAPTTFVNPPPASGQNGGQGWNTTGTTAANDAGASWGATAQNGGAARIVTSPGLLYSATSYLAPSGNKLTMDAATGNVVQQIARTLGGQTIDAGSTYFSVLLSKNTADTIRTFNMAFFNGATEQMAVGQIGATAGNSGGNIALLMNNSNPAGLIQNTTAPVAMGTGITHLIVGRIDWNAVGNETVSMWVDPTDVTTEVGVGSPYVSTSLFNITGITAVRPFAGNTATIAGQNGSAVSANFDEIRVGGTWESVTSLPVAVPEPTMTALMSIAVAGLTALRRRARVAS